MLVFGKILVFATPFMSFYISHQDPLLMDIYLSQGTMIVVWGIVSFVKHFGFAASSSAVFCKGSVLVASNDYTGWTAGSRNVKTKKPSIVYSRDHFPAVNMQPKVFSVKLKSTSCSSLTMAMHAELSSWHYDLCSHESGNGWMLLVVKAWGFSFDVFKVG